MLLKHVVKSINVTYILANLLYFIIETHSTGMGNNCEFSFPHILIKPHVIIPFRRSISVSALC